MFYVHSFEKNQNKTMEVAREISSYSHPPLMRIAYPRAEVQMH